MKIKKTNIEVSFARTLLVNWFQFWSSTVQDGKDGKGLKSLNAMYFKNAYIFNKDRFSRQNSCDLVFLVNKARMLYLFIQIPSFDLKISELPWQSLLHRFESQQKMSFIQSITPCDMFIYCSALIITTHHVQRYFKTLSCNHFSHSRPLYPHHKSPKKYINARNRPQKRIQSKNHASAQARKVSLTKVQT